MHSLHAACVVIGESGVLIRGPSGAGKSSLALLLADALDGALLADDRVRVDVENGRLVARSHPGEEGRVEIRGQGLLDLDSLGLACVAQADVALVIDLIDTAPRMPEPPEDARILGIEIGRLILDKVVRQAGLAPMLVRAALRARQA